MPDRTAAHEGRQARIPHHERVVFSLGRDLDYDPQWRDITDWQEELKPYYDQAQRMLGVRINP
ncbi:hypothetical protein AB0N62_45030, partial [Streptomyces sp. NPDC093982]|uniref:hypothetical protein n=1 Tax=Streptomyces sp. NPDC093982 TaxID=3155077 RepID=UPI003433583D